MIPGLVVGAFCCSRSSASVKEVVFKNVFMYMFTLADALQIAGIL